MQMGLSDEAVLLNFLGAGNLTRDPGLIQDIYSEVRIEPNQLGRRNSRLFY